MVPHFFYPVKDIIDNVSVALSIPIADSMTGEQGTLGPYFRAGYKLYAITAHNIFSLLIGTGIELYKYRGTLF